MVLKIRVDCCSFFGFGGIPVADLGVGIGNVSSSVGARKGSSTVKPQPADSYSSNTHALKMSLQLAMRRFRSRRQAQQPVNHRNTDFFFILAQAVDVSETDKSPTVTIQPSIYYIKCSFVLPHS